MADKYLQIVSGEIKEKESHDPVTIGVGSDAALALSGQELTLTLPAAGETDILAVQVFS